jgi:hypothetical protein
MTKKILSLLMMMSILTASCGSNGGSRQKDSLWLTFPMARMNEAFLLEDLPVLGNNHKNDERFELVVRNLSNKAIIFPNDYGLRIFVLKDGTWNPVQNNFDYADYENILPVHEDFPPGLAVVAYPDIPGLREPTIIRIIMIGHAENNEADVVGGYIDITLLP